MGAKKTGLLILTLVVGLSLSSSLIIAQTKEPSIEWNRTYGGSLNDWVHSIQQTLDGGYILAGETRSFNLNDWEAYLVKTDSEGKEIWSKTYDPSGSDRAYSVQETFDGGFILAGETDYGRGYNVYLLRTDSVGGVVWSQYIGGQDDEYARSIKPTSDGGYIVAGATKSFAVKRLGPVGWDWFLIKIAGNGEEIWHRAYGGDYDDFSNSAQQTSDGGYIVAGSKDPLDTEGANLIKTDSSGNVIWKKALEPIDFNALSVGQTSDKGFIIAGTDENNIRLIKTDSAGNVLWSRDFGSSEGVKTTPVQQTFDGGYILAAYGGMQIVKTDPEGNEMWSNDFNNLKISSVQETTDGGYIVAGITRAFGRGLDDIYLAKLSAESDGATTPIPETRQQKRKVVVLANSIDYDLASDFIGFLEHRGFEVAMAAAEDFNQLKDHKFIIILGGPDAPEGVGEIVRGSGILSSSDLDKLRRKGSKGKFVANNPWGRQPGQVVWILAGSDRGQTRGAHTKHRDSVVEEVKIGIAQPAIKVLDTPNPCPIDKDHPITHSPPFDSTSEKGDIYICEVVYSEDHQKWRITLYNQGDSAINIYQYQLNDGKRFHIISTDFPGPNYWITPPHEIILPPKGFFTVSVSTFNPGAITGPYSAGITLNPESGTLILHDNLEKILDRVEWG
jgi:hypothetical protein